MYIVPYLHKVTEKHGRTIHVIDLLTDGGQRLWSEAEGTDIHADVLEPNSLVLKEMKQEASYHYLSLDSSKTDIASMYKWSECPVDSDMLCWRTFYIIEDSNLSPWIRIPEGTFKPVLERILLSLRHPLSK
jgi:hypothetical protein